MSDPRNHRLEWKPQPTFKLKWNRPANWLLGLLYLSSLLKDSSASVDMTNVYKIYCLDNKNNTITGVEFSREKLINNTQRYSLSLESQGRQIVNCSLSQESVTPISEAELDIIVNPIRP